MPEATAGEVIVRHFDHIFRFHGLPFRRPFRRPSAGSTGRISGKTSTLLYGLKLVGQCRFVLGLNA